MIKTRALLAAAPLAALVALAACQPKADETASEQASAAANAAAPREAPPMIQANRTYRCKDNSLLYAEFFTNNTVAVRDKKDGTPTILTAPGGTPPYTAEGYSLSANDAQISYTAPGKGTQSCKA